MKKTRMIKSNYLDIGDQRQREANEGAEHRDRNVRLVLRAQRSALSHVVVIARQQLQQSKKSIIVKINIS